PSLYRAEYLAGLVLDAALAGREGLSLDLLKTHLAQPETLTRLIRDFAAPRYKDAYEKGIHDHDAALILARLLPLRESAGLLRYAPLARGFAALFWNRWGQEIEAELWPERARSSLHLRQLFGSEDGVQRLREEIDAAMQRFLAQHPLPVDAAQRQAAAAYLVEELAAKPIEFSFSRYARQLLDTL